MKKKNKKFKKVKKDKLKKIKGGGAPIYGQMNEPPGARAR
jgi:hypothetical protein